MTKTKKKKTSPRKKVPQRTFQKLAQPKSRRGFGHYSTGKNLKTFQGLKGKSKWERPLHFKKYNRMSNLKNFRDARTAREGAKVFKKGKNQLTEKFSERMLSSTLHKKDIRGDKLDAHRARDLLRGSKHTKGGKRRTCKRTRRCKRTCKRCRK